MFFVLPEMVVNLLRIKLDGDCGERMNIGLSLLVLVEDLDIVDA